MNRVGPDTSGVAWHDTKHFDLFYSARITPLSCCYKIVITSTHFIKQISTDDKTARPNPHLWYGVPQYLAYIKLQSKREYLRCSQDAFPKFAFKPVTPLFLLYILHYFRVSFCSKLLNTKTTREQNLYLFTRKMSKSHLITLISLEPNLMYCLVSGDLLNDNVISLLLGLLELKPYRLQRDLSVFNLPHRVECSVMNL